MKYQCSSFVVPGDGPELLGMPNSERLQLLSIYGQAENNEQRKRQVNELTK